MTNNKQGWEKEFDNLFPLLDTRAYPFRKHIKDFISEAIKAEVKIAFDKTRVEVMSFDEAEKKSIEPDDYLFGASDALQDKYKKEDKYLESL